MPQMRARQIRTSNGARAGRGWSALLCSLILVACTTDLDDLVAGRRSRAEIDAGSRDGVVDGPSAPDKSPGSGSTAVVAAPSPREPDSGAGPASPTKPLPEVVGPFGSAETMLPEAGASSAPDQVLVDAGGLTPSVVPSTLPSVPLTTLDAAIDDCPDDPLKTEPGVCDCGVADSDSDGDLTMDCEDDCPTDPFKIRPGQCGCEVEELVDDIDGDDVIACLDGCPNDPVKTEPGLCGCNVEEQIGDADGDGVIDCLDACASDPDKIEPSVCGCGVPDLTDEVGSVLCQQLGQALVHRYSFDGASTVVALDSVGAAHGSVVKAELDGGMLSLAGGTSDEYVNLPNQLFDGLTDVTVELWVIWRGGNAWQRVFDFGSNSAGEDAQGEGLSYFFLSPSTTEGTTYAAFGPAGADVAVSAAGTLIEGDLAHVAVALDDTGDQLVLFRNGQRVASTPTTYSLTDVQAVNNWLGRSQYTSDDEFTGSYDELRVYATALSDAAVAFSYSQGPDATFPR